jgi:hypothetical protein
VINEVVSRSTAPATDSIELWNRGSVAVLLDGMYLSDANRTLLKFPIPAGTVIPPGASIVFDEADFNPTPAPAGTLAFALSGSEGDQIWLVATDGRGVVTQFVDDVEFPASAAGESFGRIPNGVGSIVPLTQPSLGQPNSNPRVGPVVISEVQFFPPSPSGAAILIYPLLTREDLEFVEFANPTAEVINLDGWRLRGGVDFDLPPGTFLPGDVRVVVSFDTSDPANAAKLAAFRTHYGIDLSVTILGGYDGKLSDRGQRIVLQRPDRPPADDPEFIPHLTEDEVTYDDASPWPAASGNNRSLTRLAATLFGNSAASWSAELPSPGRVAFGPPVVVGDFDGNLRVDEQDIQLMCAAIGTNQPRFDLTSDQKVDATDFRVLIQQILRTTFGDANLDGVFNSSDLVQVFQTAQYEDVIPGNSRWSTGDWNCDGEFNSSDLIVAFQAAGYVP